MTEAAALFELRKLRAELPGLVRQAVHAELAHVLGLLERMAPAPLDARQAELLDALAELYDPGTAFTAAEAIDLSHGRLPENCRLAAALAALGAADEVQRLGMVLSAIATRSAPLPMRLVRAGREANSRVWLIEGGTVPA